MSAHRFHPTILRAYDIRGIFEDTLTTGDAFAIGLSFISIQKQRGSSRFQAQALECADFPERHDSVTLVTLGGSPVCGSGLNIRTTTDFSSPVRMVTS